jgi:hypothetical protein
MVLPWNKPADPLSKRTQALNAEIAALEAQIRELDARLQSDPPAPRLRSTAQPERPWGSPVVPRPAEPVFEPVNHARVTVENEPSSTAGHYNELGVRKYDLASAWQRLRRHFRGPAASNPKLINYLAAGSIQGLRPLRYEKRVARNRVVALAIVLLVLLWGLFSAFYH